MSELPVSTAEIRYFDTESGAFHAAGQQPMPPANHKPDENDSLISRLKKLVVRINWKK